MEATDATDASKTSDVVERGRLTKGFIMTVQIIISLVMFIVVLPFFALWRIPISFLYLIKKEKEESGKPDRERERESGKAEEEPESEAPKDAYERTVERFTKKWNGFRDLSINKPLVTYWSRIAPAILLVIQTSLSLALLEKSLVYHIPWFVAHINNEEYKTTKKEEWWNDLIMHVAGLAITCAPFFGLMGVGVGIIYYMVKITKYGKFKKGARKKKGGRGYDNPKEKSKDANEEGHGVKEAIMGVVDHVMHPHLPHTHLPHTHLHLHPHAGHEPRQSQQEDSPYGYSGYSEDIIFEQPGDTSYENHEFVQPPSDAVQPPKKTAWYDKNPYTLAGIASIWTGKEEKMKTGYNGRDVRRRNFEEDIEMANIAVKK
ncbi:hypothetical protein ACET3X_004860 [Alternaria dauci]|uniref:Uncharacterized protein n=1 Tax=Alternaria dauci TaxID=48095 RepID=A0ABR3UIL3_9PLEO